MRYNEIDPISEAVRALKDDSHDTIWHYEATALLDGVRMSVSTDNEYHLGRTIGYWYGQEKENIFGSAKKLGGNVSGLRVTTSLVNAATHYKIKDMKEEVKNYE